MIIALGLAYYEYFPSNWSDNSSYVQVQLFSKRNSFCSSKKDSNYTTSQPAKFNLVL